MKVTRNNFWKEQSGADQLIFKYRTHYMFYMRTDNMIENKKTQIYKKVMV